ncbi:MAG: hypothetical protein Q3960_01600 [Lactobacillus sp.]|nr:hypothetical protein [Lactobacillus sp.]
MLFSFYDDEDDSSVELDYGTEADYSPVDYQKMLRNADDIMGDGVKVVGTVLQIENNKYSNSYCLVEMNGDVDQLVLVRIEDKYYPKNKIIKGDHVTICGILSGTKEYETVLGDENEVPYVDACIKVRNSQ